MKLNNPKEWRQRLCTHIKKSNLMGYVFMIFMIIHIRVQLIAERHELIYHGKMGKVTCKIYEELIMYIKYIFKAVSR